MSSGVYEQINTETRRRGDDAKQFPCAVAVCSECGAEGLRWIATKFNPHLTKEWFEHHGWHIGRKTAACPLCVAKLKKPNNRKEPALKMVVSNPAPAEVRALTPDQRAKVRLALDSFFDDKTGMYLDGQSDQSIGTKLGLPWALVRDLREAAYGPIKASTETIELREFIADADRLIRETRSKLDAEIKRCDDSVTRLRERLHAIEKRMGFAS